MGYQLDFGAVLSGRYLDLYLTGIAGSERVSDQHLLAAASLRDPATGRLLPSLAA